jgi:hypothetical protein
MNGNPIDQAVRDVSRRAFDAAALPGAGEWLSLAAAPVFAVMALLSGLPGGPADMHGPPGHGASPAGGMTVMYLLMSVFHASPWLKLGRYRGTDGARVPGGRK